jgi:hypothetical protein
MNKNVKIGRVACGKFFDLTKMYTLKETAEMFGGSYDEKWQADDKQLLETFERDGFEFLGCVLVKEELAKALAEANVYWDMAYVVRGVLGYGGRTKKSTYLVTDVWDMIHGQGEVRAYRWNVLSTGSFECNEAQRAYKKVMKQG